LIREIISLESRLPEEANSIENSGTIRQPDFRFSSLYIDTANVLSPSQKPVTKKGLRFFTLVVYFLIKELSQKRGKLATKRQENNFDKLITYVILIYTQ
jgi:hypothetical protein